MGAHFSPPKAATIADVRRDFETLIARASRPALMTADDFGMGNPAHDPEPDAPQTAPQTARSIGMGPAWADLADVVDLASLAAGRRRHAYRMAADAVDHLIALMDALEADTEDREPDTDAEGFTDDDDDKSDAEPSLGAPENHPGRWFVDMAGRYHGGSRHHPLGDQTNWNAGANDDTEDDGDDREPEAGYCLPEGDDERDGDGSACGETGEYSLGWTAKVDQVHLGHGQDDHETTALERFGKGFIRSGPDDAEDDDGCERGEDYGSEDDPHPWRFDPKLVAFAAQVANG